MDGKVRPMRKTLTISAATLLTLVSVGGGVALATNGDQDQVRDRDGSCSQDCDGVPDQVRDRDGTCTEDCDGVPDLVRDRLRDGTGDLAADQVKATDCVGTCTGSGEQAQLRHQHRYTVRTESAGAATQLQQHSQHGPGDCQQEVTD
jgi:hypothetical protein